MPPIVPGRLVGDADHGCGELQPLTTLTDIQLPDVEPGDIAGAQQALSDILGKFESTMTTTLDGLQNLPPAPDTAGDQAKQRLLEIFTPIEQQVADAKAQLDAAGPDDTQVLFDTGRTMSSIGMSLTRMDNPMAGVQDSPELAAAEQAPDCQALTSFGM